MSALLRTMAVFLTCGFLSMFSCHASRGTMRDGLYYMEPGAPDPLACKSDSDCVADVVVKDDGCCMINSPYVQSRAWRDWLLAHTSSPRCANADCSTAIHIAQPPSCITD